MNSSDPTVGKNQKKPLEIHSSRGRLILYTVIACANVGIGLTVVAVAGATDGLPFFLLRVGGALAAGSVAIPLFYHVILRDWDWLLRRRLVFKRKYLQLLGLTGRVVGQVPYENIASVTPAWRGSGENPAPVVEISLVRRKDKATWWPRFAHSDDHDILLKDRWEKPAHVVARILESKQQRYWEERAAQG
jgi:hypothetical protein